MPIRVRVRLGAWVWPIRVRVRFAAWAWVRVAPLLASGQFDGQL